MPKYVRVRPDLQAALLHPDSGILVVPDPGVPLLDSDPLVKAFRWAFETDEEQSQRISTERSIDEIPLEKATAKPGEKRSTRRS